MCAEALDISPGVGEKRAGIGFGGRTLGTLLGESEQRLAQTRHYQGIEYLGLKESDPMGFERLHARLLSTVITVRNTMKFIASSPAVRDFEEFLINLYTPEGDSIVISTGIMVHVHTLSEFIKFMIREGYEEAPGIHDGDIFANNELWAGGVHTPDVQTVVPLFYGDVLVGWIGAVSHELETGTYEGGGMTVFSPERYGEGLHITAEKVGYDDDFDPCYVRRLKMNTRNSVWWIMDDKSKLAGALMVREAIRRLIDEVGVDYYLQATREIIEEGRRNFLARVRRTMVPGRYRGTNFGVFAFSHIEYQHPLGKKDHGVLTPVELTVGGDGSIAIDLHGASKWGYHSFNCGPGAMGGGLWITLTQMLAYDGKVNDGAYYAVRQELPYGSVLWPDFAGAASSIAWATLIPIYSNVARLISMAFYQRGFVEEVFQGTPNALMNGAGTAQTGGPVGLSNFELTASGSGARAVFDGIDCGHSIWNPEATQGDMEVWELAVPKLYLARNFVADRHGVGRFRGGAAWGSVWMIHGTKQFYSTMSSHNGSGVPMLPGLFGGYPAPATRCAWLLDTNMLDLIAGQHDLPQSIDDIGRMLADGSLSAQRWRIEQRPIWTDVMKEGDLFAIEYPSGSGFGDPLERAPAMVATDVENGLHSVDGARRAYGVVLGYDGRSATVDAEATQAERDERRLARRERAVPVSQWWAERRRRLQQGEGGFDPLVADAFRGSAELSDTFASAFDAFWKLSSYPFPAEPMF
jgi:acetone carboxylase, alpha subunit